MHLDLLIALKSWGLGQFLKIYQFFIIDNIICISYHRAILVHASCCFRQRCEYCSLLGRSWHSTAPRPPASQTDTSRGSLRENECRRERETPPRREDTWAPEWDDFWTEWPADGRTDPRPECQGKQPGDKETTNSWIFLANSTSENEWKIFFIKLEELGDHHN